MRPSVFRVHAALITGQLMFGGGSVVGKLGVAAFNPLMFALIREVRMPAHYSHMFLEPHPISDWNCCTGTTDERSFLRLPFQVVAGALLLLWAFYKDGRQQPRARDAFLFIGCGLFIFMNQACFIVGDKLVGAIIGSAWQPTQPVFTLIISILLGWEQLTLGKTAGITLSFSGAAFMVLYGKDFGAKDAGSLIAGNILFFANCLGACIYLPPWPPLYRPLPPPQAVDAAAICFYLAVLPNCCPATLPNCCSTLLLCCPTTLLLCCTAALRTVCCWTGTSLFVICAKVALGRGYPPSTVTAWSYLTGATMVVSSK